MSSLCDHTDICWRKTKLRLQVSSQSCETLCSLEAVFCKIHLQELHSKAGTLLVRYISATTKELWILHCTSNTTNEIHCNECITWSSHKFLKYQSIKVSLYNNLGDIRHESIGNMSGGMCSTLLVILFLSEK